MSHKLLHKSILDEFPRLSEEERRAIALRMSVLKITQADMAAEIGTSQGSISRYIGANKKIVHGFPPYIAKQVYRLLGIDASVDFLENYMLVKDAEQIKRENKVDKEGGGNLNVADEYHWKQLYNVHEARLRKHFLQLSLIDRSKVLTDLEALVNMYTNNDVKVVDD